MPISPLEITMNHTLARRFSVTVLGALAASIPALTGCETPPPPVQEAPPAPVVPQETEAELQARACEQFTAQLTTAMANFDVALAARNPEQLATSMQTINMTMLTARKAGCELSMDRQVQDRNLQREAFFQGVNVIPLLEPSLARAEADADASRWSDLQSAMTSIRALFTQSDPAIAPEQRAAIAPRIADLEQRLQAGLALQAQQALATNLGKQLTAATAALAADTAAEADRATTTATAVESAIATLTLVPTADLTRQAADLRTLIATTRTHVAQRANAARLQAAFEALDREATAAAGKLAGLTTASTKATELTRSIESTSLDATAKQSLNQSITGLSARLQAQIGALQDTAARAAIDANIATARTAVNAATVAITASQLPVAGEQLTAAQTASKAATALHGSTRWSEPKKSTEARTACDTLSADIAMLERNLAGARADDGIARAMTAAETHLKANESAAWPADITAVTEASRVPDATPAKRADAEAMLARLTSAMERESVLTARSPAIEQSMTDMALDSARTQIEELRTAATAPAIIEADRTIITTRADEFTQRVDELQHVHDMKVRLIIIAAVAVGTLSGIIALVIRRRRAAKIHTPPSA
jgi:hypothetical protein